MKYAERGLSSDICESCPARTRSILTAQLRGSSYRGRKITDSDDPNVDHCLVIVGDTLVADVMIANEFGDSAAAEHDADFIYADFEDRVEGCEGPTTELTDHGLDTLCTPASLAVDEFISINYKG